MIANSFFALAGLTGFLLLFYGPWQSVCTDVARQLMFEQRDKIFDMARGGMINFEFERISARQDFDRTGYSVCTPAHFNKADFRRVVTSSVWQARRRSREKRLVLCNRKDN